MGNRENMMQKVISSIGPLHFAGIAEPDDIVNEYAATLNEQQLKALLQIAVLGTKMRPARNYLCDALVYRMPSLKEVISNPAVITQDTDWELVDQAVTVMMKHSRDIASCPDHWRAHYLATSTYRTVRSLDHWSYQHNKELVSLIDAHPEDVETILYLRYTFNAETVTKEMLDEHKATHSAVSHGWL
jgi:hypothetical protein